MPADPNRIATIFAAVVARPVEERAAYLDQACGGDAELRRRVEALLQAHDDAGSFLEKPAPAAGVTTDMPAGQWIDRGAPSELAEGPGTRIGPYKLLQKIGEGGMGVVYMAEQQEPIRRMVALKIIKPGMDSAAVVARFEAERQALALMDHQNIARVFDGGTTESGRPFFVMELVKGIPITRFCDENRLTPRERLELFVPVCEAVQHAHQKGVIHRDLKPSNVLVTLYDGKPVPKVIDFGVAKALHQKLTERTMFTAFGTVVGTLEYMSPEQAEMNALDVDTRSDVYSLGVLLYELLTGTTPLERERLRQAAYTEMLRLIREEEPPRPSMRISGSGEALARISEQRKTEPTQLARLVRGELDWIVMKSLEKDRGRRYETATGLARDVEHHLKDEPVEACPPSVGYRVGKFARKNRAVLSTAAAFAVVLLIASGVSVWLAVVARKAETEADDKRKDAEASEQKAADERDRAQSEWSRAEEATKQAKANAVETGRALDRMTVAKGIQLAEEGNLFAALPCFVRPLERGGLTPEEEKMHRTRIACHLRYTPGQPRLRHVFFGSKLPQSVLGQSPVVFSPDGKRLLAVAGDVVHIWDLQRGNLLAKLQQPGRVERAQFSPDGERILSASGEATVWRWDAASGRRLDVAFVDWEGLLQRPMALLPSSPWQFLGSAGAEDSLGFNYSVGEAEFSQDTSRVLFTFPKAIRLLDLKTHRLIGQWPNKAEWVGFSRIIPKLSPDGRCLLHIRNGVAWVHDTAPGKLSSRSIDHGSPVHTVMFSPDGTRAVTLGGGIAQVWDARTWKPLSRIRVRESTRRFRDLNTAKFSPDNRLLAGWGGYGFGSYLAWWDVESEQLVCEVKDYDDLLGFNWRPDGQQLVRVSSANSGEVEVWDAASGWQKKLVLPHFDVSHAVYAPDGRTLATVGGDGAIRIWDFCDRDDAFVWHWPEVDDCGSIIHLRHYLSRYEWFPDRKHAIEVKTLTDTKGFARLDPGRFLPPATAFSAGALSLDHSRVITYTEGRPGDRAGEVLKLWDANTRQAIGKPLVWERNGKYNWVAFTPDSCLFAAASDKIGGEERGNVQLYSARTGELVGKPLEHNGSVYFAAFSPDGELLVTCSADATARLWWTKTCQPASEPLHHGDRVTKAAFTPNGKIVATTSLDGTLRLWEVGRGTPAGTLEWKTGMVWDLAFHPNGSILLVSVTNQNARDPSDRGYVKSFDIASLQEIFPAVRGLDWSDRLQFHLRKDGRVAFGLFDQRTWNLMPDNRPVSDLTKLGELYSGRRSEAMGSTSPLNKQAVQALWQELHAKYPEEFTISPKATVEWRIGQLQSASEKKRPFEIAFHRRWLAVELAEAGWQQGERGNEDMERNNYLQRLLALALHGRHAEATAAADALAARWSKDAETLYGCARVLALAAGAVKDDAGLVDRYASRAIALLRQAIDGGYQNASTLNGDADMDALRQRGDFQMLLKKLNAKQP